MAEEKSTELTKSRTKQKEKEAVIQYRGGPVTITFGDIKQLICPLAADQEVAVFLRTCQSLNLNPFASEIYLIKYSEKDKAATVIAIDAYLKASETNPEYNGHEAGVILKDSSGKLELREGAFILDEEYGKLVGAWAKVFRKDREHPFYMAVNKTECVKVGRDGQPTQFWQTSKQPLMLRKTALKRALVEAFPDLFSGAYSTAEFEEIPEGTLPSAFAKEGEPDWNKFWAKVAEIGYKGSLIDREEIRTILGVTSLKDWVDSGKTLEDAINKLTNIKANVEAFDQLPSASGPSPELEPDLPMVDNKLLEGWKIVCESVKMLLITEKQLNKWFEHYNIQVTLADFDKPSPPSSMTNEILGRLQDSFNVYQEATKEKS